jgi:arabinose operon protein AraL
MNETYPLPAAVVFDLDGTIYLGDSLIPGAERAVARLREEHIKTVFLTNKPIKSPQSYAEKLSNLGIPSLPDDVVTSVTLTRDYLRENFARSRLFVIGEAYLTDTLVESGHQLSDNPDETDVVVVSMDRSVDYSKLKHAYDAVQLGASIVATNPDLVCPDPEGDIIDAGASIAALEALLHRRIEVILGKPTSSCAFEALRRLDCRPEETMMVGDRLETDIRMAVETGMRSCLVFSGVTGQSDLHRFEFGPDLLADSVADLPRLLGIE